MVCYGTYVCTYDTVYHTFMLIVVNINISGEGKPKSCKGCNVLHQVYYIIGMNLRKRKHYWLQYRMYFGWNQR